MNRTVIVIAAHPDDEVLGCGGSLARHVAQGDSVYLLFLADGVTSRDSSADSSLRNQAATNPADG